MDGEDKFAVKLGRKEIKFTNDEYDAYNMGRNLSEERGIKLSTAAWQLIGQGINGERRIVALGFEGTRNGQSAEERAQKAAELLRDIGFRDVRITSDKNGKHFDVVAKKFDIGTFKRRYADWKRRTEKTYTASVFTGMERAGLKFNGSYGYFQDILTRDAEESARMMWFNYKDKNKAEDMLKQLKKAGIVENYAFQEVGGSKQVLVTFSNPHRKTVRGKVKTGFTTQEYSEVVHLSEGEYINNLNERLKKFKGKSVPFVKPMKTINMPAANITINEEKKKRVVKKSTPSRKTNVKPAVKIAARKPSTKKRQVGSTKKKPGKKTNGFGIDVNLSDLGPDEEEIDKMLEQQGQINKKKRVPEGLYKRRGGAVESADIGNLNIGPGKRINLKKNITRVESNLEDKKFNPMVKNKGYLTYVSGKIIGDLNKAGINGSALKGVTIQGTVGNDGHFKNLKIHVNIVAPEGKEKEVEKIKKKWEKEMRQTIMKNWVFGSDHYGDKINESYGFM